MLASTEELTAVVLVSMMLAAICWPCGFTILDGTSASDAATGVAAAVAVTVAAAAATIEDSPLLFTGVRKPVTGSMSSVGLSRESLSSVSHGPAEAFTFCSSLTAVCSCFAGGAVTVAC